MKKIPSLKGRFGKKDLTEGEKQDLHFKIGMLLAFFVIIVAMVWVSILAYF